jgi:hypothetical protein
MDHTLFAKLQELPARLKNCPIPMCTACTYRKASRKAWRSKSVQKAANNQDDLQLGDIVSADQTVSPILGLVVQITGTHTTKWYNCATVYVDQATRLGYVCASAEGCNIRTDVRRERGI